MSLLPLVSFRLYHKYNPAESPITIAPEPATVPAIFNLFEDSAFGSADGVGEALKFTSRTGDRKTSADLLDPKTEVVFLEEAGDGEFLGVGLDDFDLPDVGELDWEVVLGEVGVGFGAELVSCTESVLSESPE